LEIINKQESIRNQYYGYLAQALNLKIINAKKKEVSKYLFEMETINIGFDGNLKSMKKM
jgi:hypothetical protein